MVERRRSPRRMISVDSIQKHDFSLDKLEAFADTCQYVEPDEDNDCEWPRKEDLRMFPLQKMIKLKKISFKQDASNSANRNGDPLGGIQLSFTNGV